MGWIDLIWSEWTETGLSVELGSENFREKLQDYKYKGLAVLEEDSVTKHSRLPSRKKKI